MALAFLLASSEVRVVGVSTVCETAYEEARLACALLSAAGRPDVPVAAGLAGPIAPGSVARACQDNAGPSPSDALHSAPDRRSAASLLLETAGALSGDLLLIAAGPLTNVARMARDHPHAFHSLRGLVVMGGSFLGVDARSIRPETNFRRDPQAADAVLASRLPLRLVGQNVTRSALISTTHVAELKAAGTPRGEILASAAQRLLLSASGNQAPLRGAVAAAAAVCPGIITWRALPVRVQTMGPEAGVLSFDRSASAARKAQVAVELDTDAFESLFWQRIRAFAGVI